VSATNRALLAPHLKQPHHNGHARTGGSPAVTPAHALADMPTVTKELIDVPEQQPMIVIVGDLLPPDQAVIEDPPVLPQRRPVAPAQVVWDEADLLEFAGGSIARVFGPEYAAIDSYARRVRLPLPPYLLVSRVTKISAQRGSFKPCSLTTEYDIPHDAWYSVDSQVPIAIAIESGQCDLLLISYLGIDFECIGERVYRLLDCRLTFLDDLPKNGTTLRYDIKINSFARSGDTLLFFFSYECFVGETMILKMDGGCAGFFSDAELADGRGVVDTRDEIEQRRRAVKQRFTPPLACDRRAFGEPELQQLIAGQIAACFGPAYDQGGRNRALRLPPRGILMIDRVVSVEPAGGDWGLGLILAEKELAPDHWYFPCHFKDDQVMAGSLMAEGCCQLLQFYMLFLGMQAHTADARFQPMPGLAQVVRCRGQVTPMTGVLVYRMEVTELGLAPHPYVKVNVDIILEGKAIVRFRDLALQLIEKSQPAIQPPTRAPLYDESHIREFATGSITACFGPEFALYEGRRTPRTPNGELQLFSRIVALEGHRRDLSPGASLVSEYDVPASPWFCEQNSYPTTPYSVLMELALQPCGFLSAWLGSTLSQPDQDFYFRNLDGAGLLLREIDLRGKRVVNRLVLQSSNELAGIIIQKFEHTLSVDGREFYQGEATFGYFAPPALVKQAGLDGGRTTSPWHTQAGALDTVEVSLGAGGHPLGRAQPGRPYERLASGKLGFLDRALVIERGGRHGAGYVYAEKQIDPSSWFFGCHFYTDPVMPGSFGVEAVIEALQIYALQCGLGQGLRSPRFGPIEGVRTVWKYRGQILPSAGTMTLEAHISRVERRAGRIVLVAEASVWRDGQRIYEISQVGITLSEAQPDRLAHTGDIGAIDIAPATSLPRRGPAQPIAFDAAAYRDILLDQSKPYDIVRADGRVGLAAAERPANRAGGDDEVWLATLPALHPEQLGDPAFRAAHGVRYAYAAGAMANGIASVELVTALGQAGILASFGAAGLVPARVEDAIQRIQRALPDGPYALNLIHSPSEEALERRAVELYLLHSVRTVEASAFLSLTPHVVRYRAAGLQVGRSGAIEIGNRIIAKVSRHEVAGPFMRPAPDALLQPLVEAGQISPLQARLAAQVPMADDITVEADSGGHTDNRSLVCLLPSILALRDDIQAQQRYPQALRIGAAGGIGTPSAALAAFMMGAAYVVTGSINQACIESGASAHTRRLLAQAGMADVIMAPAADMFEMGVKVQLLKRGTLFPMRAQKLYELYQKYESIEAIPAAERAQLERQLFRKPLDTIWHETEAFFAERDPEQIRRAADNPKRKMALVFRWYLGLSSRWSNTGEAGRELDYQIWCGPAMGAFNDWVRGSYLEAPEQRRAADIARQIMAGAAYLLRVQQLRAYGVSLPPEIAAYRPEPLTE
jgi:PfaD family protein